MAQAAPVIALPVHAAEEPDKTETNIELTSAGHGLGAAVRVSVPVPEPAQSKPEAQYIGHLDWRFGLAPVLLGALLCLPLLWLGWWVVPCGALLGAVWAWRRWRAIDHALTGFKLEWVFEKVLAYGPCALGERSWWPTGVLYLTDQTLKFKPFNHTNEREVSLDPVRLTGVDFPAHRSWPSDWRCLLVTSNYGPVFGIMKVFDRTVWEQHLKAAKQRALNPSTLDAA